MNWTVGVMLLTVTLVCGCTPSHTMQRGSDDGACPARYMAAPLEDQPDAEAPNTLTWSGPTEARDIEQNNVWCRTVGRPVVRALPQGRGEEAITLDSVAVLTWNVFLGGGDVMALLVQELGFTMIHY